MISRRKAIAGAAVLSAASMTAIATTPVEAGWRALLDAGMFANYPGSLVPQEVTMTEPGLKQLKDLRDLLLPGLRGAHSEIFGRAKVWSDFTIRDGGLDVLIEQVTDRMERVSYRIVNPEEVAGHYYKMTFRPRLLEIMTKHRDGPEPKETA